MYRTIKEISIDSMDFLNPVLHKWQRLMDVDFWDEKRDALWWYNEQALVSLLAGAIWKCTGGWALEEFTTSKWKASIRGKHKKGRGRGDIMFGNADQGFVAEAKQCWPIIRNRNQGAKEIITETLSNACRGSSRLPSYGYHRLGIVFVVPCIHESKQKDSDVILDNFLNLFSAFKNTAIAWNFPPEKRNLKGGDGYIYPGIVLMLKPLRLRK